MSLGADAMASPVLVIDGERYPAGFKGLGHRVADPAGDSAGFFGPRRSPQRIAISWLPTRAAMSAGPTTLRIRSLAAWRICSLLS